MTIGLAVLLAALTLIAPLPLSTPASGSDGWETQAPPVSEDPAIAGVMGAGQAEGWIVPAEGAEVSAPVELRVQTSNVGRWARGVDFYCTETGDGVHEPSPKEGCKPSAAGQAMPNGVWGTMWFPPANSYGHNGAWSLTAVIHYLQFPMQMVDVQLPPRTVTVKDLVILADPVYRPEGQPSDLDIVWLDPTSTDPQLRYPRINFTFDYAPPYVDMISVDITIYDLVGGGTVATADKSRIQREGELTQTGGWWQWSWGVAPAPGPYGFSISVVRCTADAAQTHSRYLSFQRLSASAGSFADGHLPLTVTSTLSDLGDEQPSSVVAYVVDASVDNQPPAPRFRVLGDGQALSTEGRPTTIQLDPLDGSPHYIIVQAVDAHGDNALDGNRTHTNWPALPRAARIDTRVTEVWPRPQSTTNPNTTGHVYVSDTLAQFPEAPLLFRRPAGTPVRCQTADRQATIEALVELTVVDSDPTNDATSTSATCGGMQVYFRSRDPDSNTLWDQSSEGVDNPDTDDNVDKTVGEGRGTVAPEVSVAAADQSGGDPPTNRAVATTTLTFTDHQAGDNYVVDASTCQMPATAAQASSGVLTAWKLIYYERDRMPTYGRLLTQPASAGDTVIHVANVVSAWLHDLAVVFDPEHQDASDTHRIIWVSEVNGTLTLETPLVHDYQAGGVGAVGILTTVAPHLCQAVYPGGLGDAFTVGGDGRSRAFVEWRPHPGEHGVGLYPTSLFRGFDDDLLPYFHYRGQPNVAHLIDGLCFAPDFGTHADGTGMAVGRQVIMMQYLSDGERQINQTQLAEMLVHECGHLFGLTDLARGHPDHANHLRNDGCVMLYASDAGTPLHPNDGLNGIAQFGGPVPAVGEPADPTQPVDLRDGIAGRGEPLPGAPEETP